MATVWAFADWTIDGMDIADCWALTPADRLLVMAKSASNRVDFALLLLFTGHMAGFPTSPRKSNQALSVK
jgi:hypothetical protein